MAVSAIVIGTRETPLARVQAELVSAWLTEAGAATTVRAMSSVGDRSLGGSFAQGKGVFTGELETALRNGEVDLVVHSLKDLPVDDEPDLLIGAVPKRERPHDLLLLAPGTDTRRSAIGPQTLAALLDEDDIAANDRATAARSAFAALAETARLGTSSPRRQAGALALRPDLVCCAVRGSVGRRLEWLGNGAIDALLGAEAGILRLARAGKMAPAAAKILAFRLDLATWPCAPGQGALAVQILRGGPLDGHPVLAAIDHPPTRVACGAERSLLAELGGGCLRPFGAWARSRRAGTRDAAAADTVLAEIHAAAAADDWRAAAANGDAPRISRAAAAGGRPNPKELAVRVEQDLARVAVPAVGADTHGRRLPALDTPDLVVTSGDGTTRRLTRYLEPGIRVASFPATEVEILDTVWPVDRIDLTGPRREWPWLLISSPTAGRVVASRAGDDPLWGRLPWCALNEGTARALLALGVPPNLAARADGGREFAAWVVATLGAENPLFVPHSARGGERLLDTLDAAGRRVIAWPAYTVRPRTTLGWPGTWQGRPARVLFTAPSAVDAFAASDLDWPASCWAIGPTTADALRQAGAADVTCAQEPTAKGIERLWREEVGA